MPVTLSDARPIEVVDAATAAGYDSYGLTLWGFSGGASAQLCDAPLLRPPEPEYVMEGRTNRLYPGEGGLPLGEFLDALPPGRPLGVEVPNLASNRHAPTERARLALGMTRRYLAARGA